MIGAFQVGPFQRAYQQSGQIAQAGRRRRRLYLDIDGQQFEVESAEHAQALLDRAKALAREVAPQRAETRLTAHLVHSPTQRPKIEKPRITSSSPELQEVIRNARDSLARIYSSAYLEAEIKLRLHAQMAEDDEDDLLLLL